VGAPDPTSLLNLTLIGLQARFGIRGASRPPFVV
jgi:hypothetical protein